MVLATGHFQLVYIIVHGRSLKLVVFLLSDILPMLTELIEEIVNATVASQAGDASIVSESALS